MGTWLHYFWAMVRQNIMVESLGRAKLFTSWQPGSRERERERERESRGRHSTVTYFLPLGSNS
jgi:hypothetical protein